MAKSITGCCPPFKPSEWEDKTFTFDRKPFIKFSTRSVFHIPLNMSSRMQEVMTQVEAADATSPDGLMLSDESSLWRGEHYLAVTKNVPGVLNVLLSGTYLTKVFDGPYKNMGEWRDKLVDYTKSKGEKPIKTFFNYAFCPNCAKAYGHNYVVGFEQIR